MIRFLFCLGFTLGQINLFKPFDPNDRPENRIDTSDPEYIAITNSWRLPREIDGSKHHIPYNYTVELIQHGFYESDRVNNFFRFEGESTVLIESRTLSSFIVMHSGKNFDFTVTNVWLDGVEISKFEQYAEKNYLIMQNELSTWPIGSFHEIKVKFNGAVRKDNSGLYETSYPDADGNVHWMAGTQMECCGARKMFPCFDEPEYKAFFDLTVHTKYPEYHAIFNTEQESVGPSPLGGDYYVTKFDRTMQMSTYILALVISDYDRSLVARSPETDTSVTILGPKVRLDKGEGDYALQLTMDIVDGFSSFYGYNYADAFLPGRAKSDQVGLSDFLAGAMENWGLVTYQNWLIYILPEEQFEYNVMSVATVFGHELQHQWTGNLITCTWWDEIWINEAFADLGGYLALKWAEPTWNLENEFIINELFRALRFDDRTGSRPLINKQNNGGAKVENPAQIMGQFDLIAYQKGGSIVRMMLYCMGEDRWQLGMQDYLNTNKYTNTDGEIYFKHMQSALDSYPAGDGWDLPYDHSGATPFNKTFDGWVRQMGYPVLRAQADQNLFLVSQSRFLQSGDNIDEPASSLEYKWTVPLPALNQDNEVVMNWMLSNETTVGVPKNLWFDPEGKIFAYYIIEDYQELKKQVNDIFLREEKAAIGLIPFFPKDFHNGVAKYLHSYWKTMVADMTYASQYFHILELTRIFSISSLADGVQRWPMWNTLAYVFNRIVAPNGRETASYSARKMMMFSSSRKLWTDYMGPLAKGAVAKVFPSYVDGGSHDAKRAVRDVVDWACFHNEESCLAAAAVNFEKVMSGEMTWDEININMRDLSKNYGIRAGGKKEIDFVKQEIYSGNAGDATLAIRTLSYMNSQSADLGYELFNDLLDDQDKDNLAIALEEFARQTETRDFTITYLQEFGKAANDLISLQMGTVVQNLCAYIQTQNEFDEIMKIRDLIGLSDLSAEAIGQFRACEERLEDNVEFMNAYGSQIIYWLRNYDPNYPL